MRFINRELSDFDKYDCINEFEPKVRRWLDSRMGLGTNLEIEPEELDRIAASVAQRLSDELVAYWLDWRPMRERDSLVSERKA